MEAEIQGLVRKKTWKEWVINMSYTLFLVSMHWLNMWISRYESMFYLYIWLLVYIFLNLFTCHILWKRRLKKKPKLPKNSFTKVLNFIFLPIKQDFVCLKTSLYLFFAIVLVVSQVTSLAPTMTISDTMRDLLDAIQYGFAPLIAFDQVFNQFRSDQITYAEEDAIEVSG